MEWLHYIIASQFEKYQKDLMEAKKYQKDDIAWSIFSLIGSFSITKYIDEILKLILLPVVFLLMYFVVYKVLIVKIMNNFKKWWNKKRGYSINKNDKTCKNHVYLLNGILTNQVLLANSFIEKSKSAEYSVVIREYYLVEALHYLKNPVSEIHLIVCDGEIFKKIIYIDDKSEVIGTNIKIYRLVKLLKIIEYILDCISNDKSCQSIVFNCDLENTIDKFNIITDKLVKNYGISLKNHNL